MTDPIAERFVALESAPPEGPYLDGEAHLSFGDLTARTAATSALLAAEGLGPGDRVAVCCANPADLAVLVLACLRTGTAAVVLDAGARPAELDALLERSRARALFVDATRVGDVASPARTWTVGRGGGGLKARLLGGAGAVDGNRSWPACVAAVSPGPTPPAALSHEAPAVVLATSGTTGGPKLVPLSRGCLVHQGDVMGAALEVRANDRVLNLMHPSHVDGVVTGVFLSFWRGSTFVWPGPFSIPELPRILDMVQDEKATHVVCVPTVLNLAMRLCAPVAPLFATPYLRMVVSTAAPLAPALWERFESETGKPVVNVYGTSETGNLLFTEPAITAPRRSTIGRPHGCEARIVGDDGAPVPDGDEGELQLRGPSVLRAYLDGPATPEWFPTGDVAVRHADGSFEIRGRRRHIAIVGGRNVQLEEVEEALLLDEHVREAAAVSFPDEAWGERVVAAVVAVQPPLDVAAVRASLTERLSDHKLPRTIVEVSELPRGRSGKVLRDRVVCVAREALSAADADVPGGGGDVLARVRSLAAASFGVPEDQLTGDSAPADTPGWDSMAHLDLVVRLEDEFGVELETDDVVAIGSLGAAARIVSRTLRGTDTAT